MLIANSDEGVQPVTLHDQIAAEPGVIAVDYFDAESGTPTLAQLQQYNIVVAFSDSPYADPWRWVTCWPTTPIQAASS